MEMVLVRLRGPSNTYQCWMPPDHVGAWIEAMAKHGTLDKYIYGQVGYTLEIMKETWQ